jgi:hypothetical protein
MMSNHDNSSASRKAGNRGIFPQMPPPDEHELTFS